MWKSILAAIAALVIVFCALGFYLSDKIYPRFPHTAIAPAAFDRTFSPDELKADIEFLTQTVERVHPDVSAIVHPQSYLAEKQQILDALHEPKTRREFYRVIAPLVGTLYSEGHTELVRPTEEWEAYRDAGGTVLPFAAEVEPTGLTVTRSFGADPIPAGAQLITINGIAAESISRWLIDAQSMETMTGRKAYAAARFAFGIWALGIRPPYEISFRATGQVKPTLLTSPGVPVDQWTSESDSAKGDSINLTIEDGVAHLVVKNFEQPWDTYEASYRDAFQRIHDAKIDAVVLDLRNNSGGDSRQSDELQTYLSDDFLPAIGEVEVKATPEVKTMYRSLLPEGFGWIPLANIVPQLRGIMQTPDGGFFRSQPEGNKAVKRKSPNKLAFHGDLYLLVGPYTYSTAMIAAAPYKYWKRATVIGQPTEEGLTFFGDYYEFDLPNTKLQMHVSHKRFRLVGSTGRNSQIEPDIATTDEHPDAYRLALDTIVRKRSANP